MTYSQYQKQLDMAQRTVMFEIKVAVLPVGGEFSENDLPWKLEYKNKKDRVYVSDLNHLLNNSGG